MESAPLGDDEEEIPRLIGQLRALQARTPPLECDEDVFAALRALHAMIGLHKLKAHVCRVVREAVMRKLMPRENAPAPLLHIALLGSAGVGKTTVGVLIARIVAGLRVLTTKPGATEKKTKKACGNGNLGPLALKRLQQAAQLQSLEATLIFERGVRHIQLTKLKQTLNIQLRKLRAGAAASAVGPAAAVRSVLEARRAAINTLVPVALVTHGPMPGPPPGPVLPPGAAGGDSSSDSSPRRDSDGSKASSKHKVIFHVGTPADLKAEYLGQSGPRTRAFYEKCFGGVAFIDEAYELFDPGYSSGDAYGAEVLAVTVDYMTRFAGSLMVIFAGYPKKMRDMIAHQEGLSSRLAFVCDMDDYTSAELVEIFEQQVRLAGFRHAVPRETIDEQFARLRHLKALLNGRHVQKLVTRCSHEYTSFTFDLLFTNDGCPPPPPGTHEDDATAGSSSTLLPCITQKMFILACEKSDLPVDSDAAPAHMFS